ncbi:RodZ domain-containing protein [Candidatus Oleimmundimicrobium sp.]|uniref:helix-turn-helix domain-containing protein n=1 Tax=Candidatus Oleimmundimicrobium sp. TaxID=3060597 RepID=UPI00271F196B|nr:RodZ domain-containing protein [Candidatus Oleimmundimicrobium sp.]MDO8885435.1 DUF4115 domain-containing protein [Candidatus Oleimmundimicrobium sp.]
MGSIGKIFKNRREQLGISLKDVENNTKIRKRYLEAIENDNFGIIPGSPYVKGFIRTYASFLKIDSNPLIKEYESGYGESLRQQEEKYLDFNKTSVYMRRRLNFVFFVVGIFILITLIVLGARALRGRSEVVPGAKEKNEVPLEEVLPPKEESAIEDAKQPANDVLAPNEAPNLTGEEFKIKVTALDTVWLRVFVDGEKVLERILEKGEFKEWIAKGSVIIKSGNGQLVQIEKDGELLGELGIGLEEKTFTSK